MKGRVILDKQLAKVALIIMKFLCDLVNLPGNSFGG